MVTRRYRLLALLLPVACTTPDAGVCEAAPNAFLSAQVEVQCELGPVDYDYQCIADAIANGQTFWAKINPLTIDGCEGDDCPSPSYWGNVPVWDEALSDEVRAYAAVHAERDGELLVVNACDAISVQAPCENSPCIVCEGELSVCP